MSDFATKLKSDLIEQFKGQPHIEAIMEAVGEQLQDLYDFFVSLRDERTVNEAVGKQLDGVGDIVVLTRGEAGELASIANPGEAVTDEVYRRYLIYKILRNTNTCTYHDVMASFQMFWDKPLYYSEDPDVPATMMFKTDVLLPEDEADRLLRAPIIKAAGVAVKIVATTETPVMSDTVHVGAALGKGYTITRLPELVPDYNFEHTERVSAVAANVTKTVLPVLDMSENE